LRPLALALKMLRTFHMPVPSSHKPWASVAYVNAAPGGSLLG
jgi:hypothetical protein